MPNSTRSTQVQVKVTPEEKARFQAASDLYRLKLAAFARYAMEYVAQNRPQLLIDPMDDPVMDDPVEPQNAVHRN